MRAAKLIILVAGVLGIGAFFQPIASFTYRGGTASVTAYEVFTGVSDLETKVDRTTAVDGMSDGDLAKARGEAYQTIREIKGVVIACFVPAALLALIGLVGVIRGRLGRVLGMVAIVAGVVGLAVFYLLNAGVESDPGAARGIAMWMLLGSGALGLTGGVMALVSPDRGRAG